MNIKKDPQSVATCKVSTSFLDSGMFDVVFWFVIERQLDCFSSSRKNTTTVADIRSDDLLCFVLENYVKIIKKYQNYENFFIIFL